MANGTKGGGGNTGAPTNDQLKITSQMAGLISQMATMSSKISQSFETQAEATAKMAENMKEMGTGEVVAQLVEVNKTLKEVAEALSNLKTISVEVFEEVAEGAETAAVSTQELGDQIKKAGEETNRVSSSRFQELTRELGKSGKGAKSFKQKLKEIGDYLADEFPVAVGAALGALSGLQQSFSNLVAAGSSILGFFSSAVSAIWELGKAILTLPLKMLGGLIEMANSSAGGSNELAEAINGLRKEFGSLAGPTNSAIMSLSKSMGSLNVAGLSAMRIFGNLADRINLLKDLFLQGGAAVRSFSDEIVKSNGLILAYQKGLGLSNEEMGTMALYAKRDGKTMKSVLNDITKQSLAMGKAFGLDAKIISKEMAKAAANMAQFGHMSIQQLGVAVSYAQKLGISLESIAGTMDQFTVFEDAAENVSSLNNAFGTQIDLNEIMNEDDPAKKAEIIKKALLAQGVTADKLSYAQRKLIKQLTGFDDAAVNATLSTAGAKVELADMQKVADKTAKTVMTDAQAMSKLADAMERVFKGGGERPKSFWDAFTTGLERGFKMIPGVQKLFQNIRGATDQFTLAGMKMSQMIYDKFPGVQKIVKALTDLFDPKKFQDLLGKIMGHIGKFMDDLKSGKASFKDLMRHLKDEFFSFFKAEGKGGEDLLSGFGEFFDALKVIFAGAIEWILTQMGELFEGIAKAIEDPPDINAGGIAAGANRVLSPIAEAFRNGMNVLGPALEHLFSVLIGKLADIVLPKIKAWAQDHWKEIALILFGPAAAQALLGAGVALLGKGIAKLFTSAFSSAAKDGSVQDSVKKMHEDVMGKLGKMGGGPQAAAAQPSMTDEQVQNYKKMETSVNWSKVMQFLVGLAGVVAIGLVAYWAALKIVKGKSIQDLIAAGALLVIVATTAAIAAKSFQQLEKYDKIAWPSIGKFLLAFGATMLIGVAAIGGMLALVKKYNPGAKDVAILLGLTLVIGALGAVAAGISYLAANVGKVIDKDPKAFIVGILAIATVTLAVVATAMLMLKALQNAKDVQPAAMEGAAKILDSIGTLALKAGLVALEALAIGAIIMSTGGIGAAALAVGLLALAAIVGALAMGAVKIMKELAKMDIGNSAEFQTKVDAFIKVMNVVLDTISRTKDILDAVYEFTGFFSSTAENAKMVATVTQFVNTLFFRMRELVDSMIEAAKSIPASQVEPIKAFASLLDTLGKLISTVAQSASNFVSDTGSWLEKIMPGSANRVVKKMAPLTEYVEKLLPKLQDLIKAIIENMKGFTADPAALGAMGQAVGGIFTGVAAMMQAIMPDPSKFQQTAESSASHMFGMIKAGQKFSQVDTKGMETAMTFMTTVMEKVSSLLPPLIKSIGDELVSIINRVDKDKISGLSAIGSIIGAIAQLASGLIPKSTEVKFPDKSNWTLIGDNVNNITIAAPDLGKMLDDLKDKLPPLIDVIIAAAAKMPTGESADKQIDQLTKVFEMLPNLADMAKTLSEKVGGGDVHFWQDAADVARENTDKLVSGISGITDFLMAVVYDRSVLPSLIDVLARSSNTIGDASKIKESIDKLKTLFDSMTSFGGDTFSAIKDFADDIDIDDLKKASEQIAEKSPLISSLAAEFAPFGLTIAQMSTALNTLSDALSKAAEIKPEDLIKKFETTLNTLTVMLASDALKKAEGMKASLTYMQDVIGAGIVPTVKAVEDMIAQAQKLENAIGQGLKIDLDAKLKSFANKFGKVGAKGAYTVTARDVNIHVKFNVTMDAQSIEKIMITGGTSIIRNRMNLLIDAANDGEADKAESTQKTLATSGKIQQGVTPTLLPGGG